MIAVNVQIIHGNRGLTGITKSWGARLEPPKEDMV
jgi:hypothetical protein